MLKVIVRENGVLPATIAILDDLSCIGVYLRLHFFFFSASHSFLISLFEVLCTEVGLISWILEFITPLLSLMFPKNSWHADYALLWLFCNKHQLLCSCLVSMHLNYYLIETKFWTCYPLIYLLYTCANFWLLAAQLYWWVR